MKANYLVVFMNSNYQNDFLIIQADNSLQAKEIVSALDKVLEVFSIWTEAEDEY